MPMISAAPLHVLTEPRGVVVVALPPQPGNAEESPNLLEFASVVDGTALFAGAIPGDRSGK